MRTWIRRSDALLNRKHYTLVSPSRATRPRGIFRRGGGAAVKFGLVNCGLEKCNILEAMNASLMSQSRPLCLCSHRLIFKGKHFPSTQILHHCVFRAILRCQNTLSFHCEGGGGEQRCSYACVVVTLCETQNAGCEFDSDLKGLCNSG